MANIMDTAQVVVGLATQVLAVDPPAGKSAINTEGVVQFLTTRLLPIVLAVIGLYITGKSARGNWSEAVSTTGIAILGLMFIGGATLLFAFGQGLSNLLFN